MWCVAPLEMTGRNSLEARVQSAYKAAVPKKPHTLLLTFFFLVWSSFPRRRITALTLTIPIIMFNITREEFILSVYRRMWTENSVKSARREAIVVQNFSEALSICNPFRFISRVCKTLWRKKNRRLVWISEIRRLPSNAQCDFRCLRCTSNRPRCELGTR